MIGLLNLLSLPGLAGLPGVNRDLTCVDHGPDSVSRLRKLLLDAGTNLRPPLANAVLLVVDLTHRPASTRVTWLAEDGELSRDLLSLGLLLFSELLPPLDGLSDLLAPVVLGRLGNVSRFRRVGRLHGLHWVSGWPSFHFGSSHPDLADLADLANLARRSALRTYTHRGVDLGLTSRTGQLTLLLGFEQGVPPALPP